MEFGFYCFQTKRNPDICLDCLITVQLELATSGESRYIFMIRFMSLFFKVINLMPTTELLRSNSNTRMWANAQRDGRRAEYRWGCVNAAKFGWRPECRANAAKTRNPLKFAGVPQTGKPISAASGLKFTILPGHVEEVLLFNKFFSGGRYMP